MNRPPFSSLIHGVEVPLLLAIPVDGAVHAQVGRLGIPVDGAVHTQAGCAGCRRCNSPSCLDASKSNSAARSNSIFGPWGGATGAAPDAEEAEPDAEEAEAEVQSTRLSTNRSVASRSCLSRRFGRRALYQPR